MGDTDTLDTPDTSDTMAMDSDITDTARGLLMLRLIPTFLWRTPWIRTPRICRTRTLWIRIRQILLRQIDYIKIFSEPSAESWTKMDYYQFEVPFTSAAVSVLP